MASGGGREKLVLAGLLLGVLAIGLFAGPSRRADDRDPRLTSFSAGDKGARGLYLTLEELGMAVERRRTPYVDADPLPRVLAVMAPSEDASPAELAALGRWLEGGGILFYVARRDDAWLDSLGLALRSTRPDSVSRWLEDEFEGVAASPRAGTIAAGTPAVGGFRFAFADTSRALRRRTAGPLLVTDSGAMPVALEIRRGKGRVIAMADGQPFTNRLLRGSDAAVFFARAARAAAPDSAPVVFDEYHHGHTRGESLTGAMARFLARRPLGHAILHLAGVGLLLLFLAGRRFGSPLPPAAARRRSPLEHVEALAGAYRQAGARRTARRLLLAGLARRLGRRSPRDDQAEAELLARLAAHPQAGEPAAHARAEWEKGRQADLVALSRDVDRILESVRRP